MVVSGSGISIDQYRSFSASEISYLGSPVLKRLPHTHKSIPHIPSPSTSQLTILEHILFMNFVAMTLLHNHPHVPSNNVLIVLVYYKGFNTAEYLTGSKVKELTPCS